MLKNFIELVQLVRVHSVKKRAVVVCAHDEHTLEGVSLACKEELVEPVLIGDVSRIKELIHIHDYTLHSATFINTKSDVEAAKIAVGLIREGGGDFLMKGKVQPADLLKEVVNKKTGLHAGVLMSHISVAEVPRYHKLIALTDGGMLPHPTLQQKVQIIKNVVEVLKNIGYEKPKVAALAGVEVLNKNVVESVDAFALKEMNAVGDIKDCIVEGPISYDLALSKEIAAVKNYESPVVGETDVMLVPTMATGNILGKSWCLTGGGMITGIIVGARVPMVFVSRGASAVEKYLSIVLAAAASPKH